MNRPILNIDDVEFRDHGHGAPAMQPGATPAPETFRARLGDVAGRIGAQKLGYGIVVLPPGKRAWPAHNHRINEEAFFILEGQGEVRIGKETYPVRKGDFIAHPPGGTDTAHQIRNTSPTADLKYVAISTRESPEIVDYPDSNKVGVALVRTGPDGKPQRWWQLVRGDRTATYWDGE
jgi:uncharacterized cupin superfamily protein